MIWESHPWKIGLLKHASNIRKRRVQKRWSQASLAKVEQDVMLSFYSIRKLIEATKVATTTSDMALNLKQYLWYGKNVTKMNWDKLDELYDFESPSTASRKLIWICHQIVHSFVFSPIFSESGGLDGFLFTSDRARHQQLSHLGLDQCVQLLEHVGSDYPNQMSIVLTPKTGDFDVTAITHEEDEPGEHGALSESIFA
jgi:hypothetical protein